MDEKTIAMQALSKLFDSFPAYIDSSEIPEIDLYMDQVTTFMDTHLSGTKRNPEDKTLTKTMINNYVKDHLIPAPEKKKYSKDHVLLLLMIYYSKNILSISDISAILKPITESLFHTEGNYTLEDFYDSLHKQSISQMDVIKEELYAQFKKAKDWSETVALSDSSIDQDFLAKYTYFFLLGMDISLKKLLLERMIDEIAQQTETKEKKRRKKNQKRKRSQKKKRNRRKRVRRGKVKASSYFSSSRSNTRS